MAIVLTYFVVIVSVTVSVEVTGTVVTLPLAVMVLYTTMIKLAFTLGLERNTNLLDKTLSIQ